jgi:lipopolysaccharide/colanic/teichoic acid biosynthesis glycosyltransferase
MSMTDRATAAGFSRSRAAVSYTSHAKRAFDLSIVALLALVTLPLVLLLALAVSRDGGSAFFGHERVGRDGRRFRCWKLRTMVPDAQEVLARHLAADPAAAAEWARDQKLSADPRVTPVGRLLRATSLDELPQLWNVAVGDMSLVGPRPVTPEELERYRGHGEEVLSVRPGRHGPVAGVGPQRRVLRRARAARRGLRPELLARPRPCHPVAHRGRGPAPDGSMRAGR